MPISLISCCDEFVAAIGMSEFSKSSGKHGALFYDYSRSLGITLHFLLLVLVLVLLVHS